MSQMPLEYWNCDLWINTHLHTSNNIIYSFSHSVAGSTAKVTNMREANSCSLTSGSDATPHHTTEMRREHKQQQTAPRSPLFICFSTAQSRDPSVTHHLISRTVRCHDDSRGPTNKPKSQISRWHWKANAMQVDADAGCKDKLNSQAETPIHCAQTNQPKGRNSSRPVRPKQAEYVVGVAYISEGAARKTR